MSSKTSQKNSKQLEMKIKTWGGRRKGSGRPNKTGRLNHMRRVDFSPKHPLLITQKLLVEGLRQKAIHALLKEAIDGMRDYGARVSHYSLQGNHLHMILEINVTKSISVKHHTEALSLAMKSFGCRFAKGVKQILNLDSAVIFKGRYHCSVLTTPSQVKNALRYVLLNQAKHAELIEHIDIYSSGFYFSYWRELLGNRFTDLVEQQAHSAMNVPPLYLSRPTTWLLREGWKRAKT